MTLAEYAKTHSNDELRRLAKACGTKLSYLRALIYMPRKRVSIDLADKLIDHSGGEITLKGLVNPVPFSRISPKG